MIKPVDISIIIVNFDTLELLRQCLTSIYSSEYDGYVAEVIVVDNGSTDGSVEMVRQEFPKTRCIHLDSNYGFSTANNKGIEVAKGSYILLLNSDTVLPSSTISTMLRYMEKNPDVGASTCAVLLPNGKLDPACHRGFPTPWVAFTYMSKLSVLFPRSKVFARYHLGHENIQEIHEIDCQSGAFFLVRRTVIDSVGMLDEDFFMYGEDVDWAFRIKEKKWKIVFNPEATVTHYKKQSGRASSSSARRKKTRSYFYSTMLLFYQKHYAKRYPNVVSWGIGVTIRILLFVNKITGL